jgi:hypothetical protein
MASKFGFGLSCLKTGMDRTASLNRRSTIKVRDEARERSYGDAICTCGGMTKRCIIIFLLFEFMCELWHTYYSWGNVAVVQLSFDYSHTRIHSSQAYLFFIFAYMHIFACFYACMRACFDCWFSNRDTHIDTITWAHKTRIKIDLNVQFFFSETTHVFAGHLPVLSSPIPFLLYFSTSPIWISACMLFWVWVPWSVSELSWRGESLGGTSRSSGIQLSTVSKCRPRPTITRSYIFSLNYDAYLSCFRLCVQLY